jgi:hypothetical protein
MVFAIGKNSSIAAANVGLDLSREIVEVETDLGGQFP